MKKNVTKKLNLPLSSKSHSKYSKTVLIEKIWEELKNSNIKALLKMAKNSKNDADIVYSFVYDLLAVFDEHKNIDLYKVFDKKEVNLLRYNYEIKPDFLRSYLKEHKKVSLGTKVLILSNYLALFDREYAITSSAIINNVFSIIKSYKRMLNENN